MSVTSYQRGSGPKALARRPDVVKAKAKIRAHGSREQRAELIRLDNTSGSGLGMRQASPGERAARRAERRDQCAEKILALAALVRP